MHNVVLIILDGWGIAPAWGGNAIAMAETPSFSHFWKTYPHTALKAAEEAVGLPIHEPGNSEVGHLNIGCGQIAFQNLPGISETIRSGSFFENLVLKESFANLRNNNSNLHLLGLVSDGGIHSHISHLYALLDMAKKEGIKNVYIHMITDGRDTDPMKALSYLSELKAKIKEVGIGQVESIMGRYWAMDRDKHYDRTQKAYDLLTSRIGFKAPMPEAGISENYRHNKMDEFIIPTIVENETQKFVPINDKDSVIFFNFRADRARQLIDAFSQDKFSGFSRKKKVNNLSFVTFSFLEEYNNNPRVKPAFHLREIQYPIARVLADKGKSQFHLAETEKYAHVTFFFNGGKEKPFNNEKQALVQSPKVATYDLKPEMSAPEVYQQISKEFSKFDFSVVNFANPDMVGHTGNIKATIRACEAVDKILGKLIEEIMAKDYVAIITADHGNAEQMLNPDNGEVYTEHTINPVPFILCSKDPALNRPLRLANGKDLTISDIAPTILDIMQIEKPEEMTGTSLLVK